MIFLSVVAAGLACDLLTKALIFARYFDPAAVGTAPFWWIDGMLGIETSTNGGALFGIGQGASQWFALLSVAALAGILYWLFGRGAAQSKMLTATLALVSAGILGNLYDRLGFGYRPEYPLEIKYHVRDWIHFRWEGISWLDPWPNFNIADSMLVCGAIMLFVNAFFRSSAPPVDSTSDSST